jgi:hypothetical protein
MVRTKNSRVEALVGYGEQLFEVVVVVVVVDWGVRVEMLAFSTN